MGHEFSLAHLTVLHSSPPEMVEIAARTGYAYIGIRMTAVTNNEPVYPLMSDPAMMRETKARMADTGVRVLDIELARMGPDTEPETFLAFLDAGAELGAGHVIAQLPDPNRERATERFARLCDLARQFGLNVNLEFVSWTETPDLHAAAAVVKAVDRPNAGLLVDTIHFSRSNCSLEHLRKLPRHWFKTSQVCDAPKEAPTTVEGLIHAARCERLFPGEGGLDVLGIAASMPAGIPYSLEIPGVTLEKEVGAEEYARRAIRAAEKHFAGLHGIGLEKAAAAQ